MKFSFEVEIPNENEATAYYIRADVSRFLEVRGYPTKVGLLRDRRKVDFDTVLVHTDGGCDLKRDGLGAWAFMIEDAVEKICIRETGVYIGTTNNRMEMMAVIHALEKIKVGRKIHVVSDSKYVIHGATQWLHSWKRNNWKTFSNKPVLNRDLWERLDQLILAHTVEWQHVHGHSGHKKNEEVDAMCVQAMNIAWNSTDKIQPDLRT